jgi:hypothetical protein
MVLSTSVQQRFDLVVGKLYSHVFELLVAAGAFGVWRTPVVTCCSEIRGMFWTGF